MPRTEAGKRLLRFLRKQRENDTDNRAWRNGIQYAEECVAMDLPRIEAEAVAAERERIREVLEPVVSGLWIYESSESGMGWLSRVPGDRLAEVIAAVLAIVNPEAE